MKLKITSIILLAFLSCKSQQCIFDYEQNIELSKDYERKEIKFTNPEDGVVLSGTLIYPSKEFNKVVIIVPGSGKDTRHSHFVLAKELLSNQIAVYRFDEKGIGKSGGKYKRVNETASSLEKDVISAFKQLKNLEILSNKKIGILGHSLGGIASIGAFGKGCNFDFLIQMATPVENNGAFLKYQVLTNNGGLFTVKDKTQAEVIHFIDVLRKAVKPDEDYKTSKKKAKALMKQLNFNKGKHIIFPVIIDLMKQNHEETYKASETPILFIIGSQDKVVSSIDEILTLEKLSNPNVTISLISGSGHYLNDVMKSANHCNSPYYITGEALKQIINWTIDK